MKEGDQARMDIRSDSTDSRTATTAADKSTPKHTPGPWHVRRAQFPVDGEYDYAIYADTERVIAEAFGRSAQNVFPPAEANARLIAAAPDMLAVLRDLEWIGMNDGRGVTKIMCPACAALQSRGTGHNHYCGLAAAIAKARG